MADGVGLNGDRQLPAALFGFFPTTEDEGENPPEEKKEKEGCKEDEDASLVHNLSFVGICL
jgi:hypothetical protein